ncbi:MAG: 4Fe-4S binding protein [Candidatus Thorarchaeota archaeon]|jgi:ferredoxin
MQANYGYKDGSGEFYITIDTDKCDSCGKCVEVCPPKILVMVEVCPPKILVMVGDPFDPLSDADIPIVIEAERKKIKYTCGPCKPVDKQEEEPCIKACEPCAITHSW